MSGISCIYIYICFFLNWTVLEIWIVTLMCVRSCVQSCEKCITVITTASAGPVRDSTTFLVIFLSKTLDFDDLLKLMENQSNLHIFAFAAAYVSENSPQLTAMHVRQTERLPQQIQSTFFLLSSKI